MSKSWDQTLANSVIGICIILLIIAIIFAAWASVRAANILSRGFAADPKSKPLWGTLLASTSLVCAGLGAGSTPLLLLGGAMFGVALIVAHGVELYHAENFQEPPSLERFRGEVLHFSDWWPKDEAA